MRARNNVASHRIAQNIPLNTTAIEFPPNPYPLSKSPKVDQSSLSPVHPWQSGQALPSVSPPQQDLGKVPHRAPRPTIVPLFATGTAQAPCCFSPACRHAKDIRDTLCRHPINTTTRVASPSPWTSIHPSFRIRYRARRLLLPSIHHSLASKSPSLLPAPPPLLLHHKAPSSSAAVL